MNILGTYSGIGMDTVDQLIAAEKAKGVRFTNQKTKIEAQQAAWKDISKKLESLYEKIEKLQDPKTFNSQTIKSSLENSPYLNVQANEKASPGQYQIEVKQIGKSASSIGGQLTFDDATNKIVGLKTGTIQINGTDIEINEEDSLKDITNTINEQSKETGIRASIVNNQLILTNNKMGNHPITVTGDNASALGFDGNETKIEGNEAVVIIDGLEIKSDSNKIEGVIEGLTINLTNASEGKSETITVAHDTQVTVDIVKEFIDEYNDVMNTINKQTSVGDPTADDNKTGALVGESSLLRLQSQLRSILTANYKEGPNDPLNSLAELGIEVDRQGVATFNETKFTEKLLEDPANVARSFYQAAPANTGGSEATGKAGNTKENMSDLLKNFIDTYTSSSKGVIKSKQESYERALKDITRQIDTFNERIDKKRDRYIREFSALDQAMMHAESQLDYLYSQMGMGQN